MIDTTTIPSIPGKFSDTRAANWIAKGQGSHVVKIETEIEDFETNLTNNIATRGLIVLKDPITSITISPSALTIKVPDTQLFEATDQNGNQISVDWGSSNENVGTVFPATGTATIFTALTGGATTVTATSGGVVVSAEVTSVWEDFTFAHVTDTHLGYYFFDPGMNESVIRFTDILQDTKNKNLDFIVVTGDLVEQRDPEFFMAFKNLVRGFNVKVTPGNHDRRWEFWLDDLKNYKDIMYPLYPAKSGEVDWNFSDKGYNFIGLDSGADYNTGAAEVALGELNIDIGPESDGLLEEQILRLRGEFNSTYPKIVLMHHPIISSQDDKCGEDRYYCLNPVHNDGGPGGNDNTIAFNRWDFINYSDDSNVQLVLTGHSHMDAVFNAYGKPVENTSTDRPLFIQTRDNAYRIIEVSDGKANPLNSTTPQEFINRNAKASSFWSNQILNKKSGLHAYDSQKRHTGMISCSNDFELGIPNSYYTGNYQGTSNKPEVIVGYSPGIEINEGVTEYKIFSLCVGTSNLGINAIKSVQSAENTIVENVTFNQTITDRTNTSTTEIGFYNVTMEDNSSAIVNVSNVNNYKMEIDLLSDGTIDRVVFPDSISVTSNESHDNISIITYNGVGIINLSANSGNITTASSLNPSSLPDKPSSEFPFGVLAFNISDLSNGTTIDVTITLPQNLPADTVYWKYGQTADDPTPHWYTIPLGSNDGDNVITIKLKDGGFGDDDLTENGIIVDAGGPGIPTDANPIASVENLQATTGTNWLNFTWLNPPDPDYHHVMLYLNGTFLTSITAPQNYYNFTGLQPDILYELATHTVDLSGNVNETWVNDTARTLPLSDNTPPAITFIPPTDPDNAILTTRNWTFINVSLSESGFARLEWNGVNESMYGARTGWHINKTGLGNGIYTYRAWANDSDGNVGVSETRVIEILIPSLKGDLNSNGVSADAGDLVLMKRASIGEIQADSRYDLNNNGQNADAGDLVLMKRASIGEIILS